MGASAKKDMSFEDEVGAALLDGPDDGFHEELAAGLADEAPKQAAHPSFIDYSAPEAAPAKPAPGLLEQYLGTAQHTLDAHAGELRGAWDSAGDAASGLAGGLTGHLDQRLPFGIGDAIRADREQSAARSPLAERTGEIVGMVRSPMGRAFSGEKLIGNAVAQGGNAWLQGTARRVGDQTNDNTDVLQAFLDAHKDAELGAGLGAGAHVLGQAAQGVSNAVGQGANYFRRVATGVQPSDVTEAMERAGTGAGLDYARNELSTLPEKLGLTSKYGLALPTSTAGYAEGAEELKNAGGALKGSALQRADAVVPPEQVDFAKDDILQRLLESRSADEGAYSGVNAAPAYSDLAERLQNRVPSKPSDLDAMKQAYEGNSYALKTAPAIERGAASANKTAADETRMRLGGVISGANRADPGIAADFERGSQQYGDAATLEDIAKRSAAKSMVAPMLGGAVGGLAGFQTRHDLEGLGMGAVAGAVATRGAQTYGADALANMGRMTQATLGGAASGLGGISQSAGSISAAMGGSTPRERQQTAVADGIGSKLPDTINKILVQQPQYLGRWRSEFENAGKRPGGISALLLRLQGDQEWRQTKLPELQQLTGEE